MLQGSKWITHKFGGGWATDFGPTAYGAPEQTGHMNIPFLREARNTVYEFDGGIHKAPGTDNINSSALESAASIRGLYDYWRQGATDSATQKRIIHVGTKIKADNADGTFLDIFTGQTATSIPQYSTFDDLLIIGSSVNADVPKSYDGTTAQNLAGSPPAFGFSIPHSNHQFAAGVFANPSRLYYSVPLNPEDWTGVGSGSIDIDPNDGDMITGIISFKNELLVFKGPNRGSIHRITGSSTSNWARTSFVQGLPVAWIHSIFKFGDDVGFITANGSVHSLKATAAYGDYNQAWLSYPIGKYMQENLNNSRARFFTTATDPNRGYVWIGITPSGQTTNTRYLIMDYRFLSQQESYPRWSYWDSRAFASIHLVRDTARPRLMTGGYDGFVYKLDQTTRTDNGVAINMTVETPSMTYGDEWLLKNLADAGVSLNALNDNILTFTWIRDGIYDQQATVTQGAVGGLFDVGLFDDAVFGGQAFLPRFFGLENGGDFRSIAYKFSDTADNSDLEIHSFMAKITPCGESIENT
jgi:hypothetical protein